MRVVMDYIVQECWESVETEKGKERFSSRDYGGI